MKSTAELVDGNEFLRPENKAFLSKNSTMPSSAERRQTKGFVDYGPMGIHPACVSKIPTMPFCLKQSRIAF
jgi:hypothetical protein